MRSRAVAPATSRRQDAAGLRCPQGPFRRFAEVRRKVGSVTDVTAESFKVTAQGGQIEVLKAKLADGKKIGGGELARAAGLSVDTPLGS